MANCYECEKEVSEFKKSYDKKNICNDCAQSYYSQCESCKLLAPQQDMTTHGGLLCCPSCISEPSDIQPFVSEYVRLNKEQKQIQDRMDELKEIFKTYAVDKERINNSVIIGDNTFAVKINYQQRKNYSTEQLLQVENMIGSDKFSELFEREIKLKPHDDALVSFLSNNDSNLTDARDVIEAAITIKETPTLTVYKGK